MPDALMVFDGVCNFCSGTVQIVTKMDRDGVIHFASLQSPYGKMLCEENGIDPSDPSTFLFFDRGKPAVKTDAMAAMFARLPPPWKWLNLLRIIPRPLRNAVYDWTARHRYALLGRRAACMVPSENLRSRFHDYPPAAAQG